MNKNTIVAACLGAFAVLTAVYAMNGLVPGPSALQATMQDTAALTARDQTASAPSRTASARVATAPVVSTTVVKAGQVVAVKIVTHVSSRDAKVGDPVEAVTTEDIIVNEKVVIASGTRVTGRVTEVRPARETRSAAVLRVRFSRIGSYQTRLALASPNLANRARRANQAADAALVVGGAVGGGIIGNQVTHDRGTEVGAVAGAVIGGLAAANLGANVQLKAGEAGRLRFERDLVID